MIAVVVWSEKVRFQWGVSSHHCRVKAEKSLDWWVTAESVE